MNSLGPVLLGSHAPDMPDFGNPGGEIAHNCLPRAQSYGQLRELTPVSKAAMTEQALGAIAVKDEANNLNYTYAGSSSNLWRLDSTNWLPMGSYAASSWDFAQWGNRVVATASEEKPQVITLGGTSFADLYADNFQARWCAVVRNFLVYGYVNDDDGLNEARVRWAGFGNADTIAVSKTSMADFQDLRGRGGDIQRIVGGTTGLVFQNKAIWSMNFVGTPFVFRFDLLEESIGTPAPGSVVRYGERIFFLAEDGFREISSNAPSRPIGEERVDRTVLSDLNFSFINNMTATLLEDEQAIMWAYPGAGAPGGRNNKLVIYNFASNKWSEGEEAVDVLFGFSSPFTTVEALDGIAGSIDEVPGSLDDPQYSGGKFQIGGIDHDGNAAAFVGDPKTATFGTREVQHSPGRRTVVNGVRPLVDGASSVSVRVDTRSRQQDAVSNGTAIPVNASGMCPMRANARYHRYTMEVQGGFKDALGVEPYGKPAGKR